MGANRYSPDLERLKPEIKQLYDGIQNENGEVITEGLTFEAIAKLLREKHGLLGLKERTLKDRFHKKWGWKKKLERKHWLAMRTVLDHHWNWRDQIECVCHRAQAIKPKTAKMILKEVDRSKNKPVPLQTYEEALAVLAELDFEVRFRGRTLARPAALFTCRPQTHSADSSEDDSDDGFDDNDDKTTPPVHACHIELRYPIEQSFGDVHIVHDDCPQELMELFTQMSRSFTPSDTRRSAWAKFLESDFGNVCKPLNLQWERQLRLTFAAYYIEKAISATATVNGTEDSARRLKALDSLRELFFSTSNMQVLPIVSFIDAAIIGHEGFELLEQFYDDCWKCVSSVNCFEAEVIEPFLRAGRLLSQRNRHIGYNYADNQEEKESLVVSRILKSTDLESSFRRSKDLLEHLGLRRTPTYVIMRLYHAWAAYEVGEHQRCLDVLLSPDGLPLAEQVLGLRHLQTMKCYKMKAQCYAKVENALAKDDLAIAVLQLRNFAYPIQPYKYRLLLQLASAQLQRQDTQPQDVEKALQIQNDVINYTWSYFGPFAKTTWFAVEQHIKALRMHKSHGEAEWREHELEACFERAYKEAKKSANNNYTEPEVMRAVIIALED